MYTLHMNLKLRSTERKKNVRYLRTSSLAPRFRGQKALVVEVLSTSATPVSLETLVPLIDKDGRYLATLNQWARENGGVKGSIRFHLRALKRLGMIEEVFSAATVRTHVVGWGNSQAVRLPKSILDEAQVREGDEIEIKCQDGQIILEPVNARLTLESLVAAITPENRHGEQDWGKPVGREVW
jgi:antitoxin MazE